MRRLQWTRQLILPWYGRSIKIDLAKRVGEVLIMEAVEEEVVGKLGCPYMVAKPSRLRERVVGPDSVDTTRHLDSRSKQ